MFQHPMTTAAGLTVRVHTPRGCGASALSGLLCGGGDALVSGLAAPVFGAVLCHAARRAARRSSLRSSRPPRGGQQFAIGACGYGVHGARPVVVGQDDPEVVGGGVFGAAAHRWMPCRIAVVSWWASLVSGWVDARGFRRGRGSCRHRPWRGWRGRTGRSSRRRVVWSCRRSCLGRSARCWRSPG